MRSEKINRRTLHPNKKIKAYSIRNIDEQYLNPFLRAFCCVLAARKVRVVENGVK